MLNCLDHEDLFRRGREYDKRNQKPILKVLWFLYVVVQIFLMIGIVMAVFC